MPHTQLTLPFDVAAPARRAAEAGAKRAAGGAGERWMRAVAVAIETVARLRAQFTTDEVWEFIGASPPEPRAMGAAMRRAQAAGLIRPLDRMQPSKRAANHGRMIRVWESAIFEGRK